MKVKTSNQQVIPSISNKVLVNELRDLEHFGLIRREEFTEVQLRVQYSLTTAGKTLLPILHELASWGNTHTARKITKTFTK